MNTREEAEKIADRCFEGYGRCSYPRVVKLFTNALIRREKQGFQRGLKEAEKAVDAGEFCGEFGDPAEAIRKLKDKK